MKTVVVGLSGGVDSSVSAYLLKEQGYKVIGLFMKNWEEEGGQCHAAEDYEDANRVADILNIPLHTVDFTQEYWDRVFATFLEGLKKGFTPNPDILCNREIKFDCLMEKALALGADFLATGHYCRTRDGHLLKGKDPRKDQSYFLCNVSKSALEKTLFPVGELEKTEVRKIAETIGLPTHNKRDSTGICFIGKRNFKTFISQYIPYQPGDFENTKGEIIGKHDGAAYYTIGQRKGLGIGGPGDAWFVVGKDMERNVVIIEQGQDHPALYASSLSFVDPLFINDPGTMPLKCKAKIRYRQEDQVCMLHPDQTVIFETPQRAITPYQTVAFYDGDVCLGGALINKIL